MIGTLLILCTLFADPNEQEPAFCENDMELTVVVRTAHYCVDIGDCLCGNWRDGDMSQYVDVRASCENRCRTATVENGYMGHTGLKIRVQPGNAEPQETDTVDPWVDSSNGFFKEDAVWTNSDYDVRNFAEYHPNEDVYHHYEGNMTWRAISENDLESVKFSIINNGMPDPNSMTLDVRPYKSLDTEGKSVMLKWNGGEERCNGGWVQITADVVVKCTLDPCDSRVLFTSNDCSSVLDEDSEEGRCYSLTYSLDGVKSETHCSSTCFPEIFVENRETRNCQLKKCTNRTVHETLRCGSSDCYPSPLDENDTSCSISCPPFYSRGKGVCEEIHCLERDPISGVCSWDKKNEANARCGYLRNQILCMECPENHYTASEGVCILKPCTDRKIIAGAQYACGDGSCLGQPDFENCSATCPSINYIPDDRGQCVLKDCCHRTPMVKRSGLPCDSDDCYLQPFKDACATGCPDGFAADEISSECVSVGCLGRTPSTAVLSQAISHSNRSQIGVHTIRTYSNTVTYSETNVSSVTYSSTYTGGTYLPSSSASHDTIKKKPTSQGIVSRTSNAPHTYAGPSFCTEEISVDINVNLVYLDNIVLGTRVKVTIGNETRETGILPPHRIDAVYYDADFEQSDISRNLQWTNVSQDDLNDVVFRIENGLIKPELDKYKDREDIHADLNAYKQASGAGVVPIPVNIEGLNRTHFQMMIFMDVIVECKLIECFERKPVDGSCMSSLDTIKCLTLIEPGKSGCTPLSNCPVTHYFQDFTKGNCVLLPCSERIVDSLREISCGSEGCVPRPDDDTLCDIETCPYFHQRDPESGLCKLLDCVDRNPHDGNCHATEDEFNYPCGYLKDGPKCVVCDYANLPSYAYSEGVCCAQDHYKDTVDSHKRCDLKPCTQRHMNTSTPYLCGSQNCQYQPETNACVDDCAENTTRDARGFCGPDPVENCPIPITTPPEDSPFPCREATCYYIQSGLDGSCMPTCPTGYRHDFMGVCIDVDCTKRTYNPREENWPCGWPEENCFQDLGPDATDTTLQEGYTRCVNSPPDTGQTGCTNPFFETNTTESLRTGKCTRMPCEVRRPQVVSAAEYTCGDHCLYVPPRVVDKEDMDYDSNDIGCCIDEPPPSPPAKAKVPKTVKDYWWVFLLIGLLIIVAVSVVLFIVLWKIKKHHDAQVEYDRDLMMQTADDREKMNLNRGVKEEADFDLCEDGLIFENDAQETRDTWLKDGCSDEFVVDAIRCAPPFDIVHCDRRRTLFALYSELSTNALSKGNPTAVFRKLLPEKLRDPLNPSMAIALVLRHLHQEFSEGVENITPHTLLVSSKGSLALVVAREGLSGQVQVDGAFEDRRWNAPEQKLETDATHKSDIFSLGLIMWQAASVLHEVPFAEVDAQSASMHVATGNRPDLREIQDVSDMYDIHAFTQVIEACWAQDDSERPTASQVVDSLLALTNVPKKEPTDQ